ncbi:hypothetical protein IWX90DRAFT_268352 [Phyllosticta citrichinensis]|uniref:Uncharacterized protein n=1 Tax=Phyllosticta citrichinensis TaxID=1130410 RepID=A0ABR1XML9_9PEZI
MHRHFLLAPRLSLIARSCMQQGAFVLPLLNFLHSSHRVPDGGRAKLIHAHWLSWVGSAFSPSSAACSLPLAQFPALHSSHLISTHPTPCPAFPSLPFLSLIHPTRFYFCPKLHRTHRIGVDSQIDRARRPVVQPSSSHAALPALPAPRFEGCCLYSMLPYAAQPGSARCGKPICVWCGGTRRGEAPRGDDDSTTTCGSFAVAYMRRRCIRGELDSGKKRME